MKKRNNDKRTIRLMVSIIFLIMAVSMILIRMLNHTEIDDVSPGISCPEIRMYNPDVLYVIPDYKNNPISENQEWCNDILSLNKTLEMHGITHDYKEFLYQKISQERLDYGISQFEQCFGFTPEMFKAPQLAISKENKQLIKENDLKYNGYLNQITHRVYHCNDSDRLPNWFIRIF